MENNVSTSLYDLLITQNFEPELLASSGKPVSDPSETELFSFNWRTENRDYGTVVILLGSDNDLGVYFGDNLGRGMDSQDKDKWYEFLSRLKNFATRNLLTFELNNLNRLKYTMQGMAAIKEGLFEGYYGRKNISYSDQPQQTRLMIKHSRNLGEGEARYRAIESLFVETAAGERFRVPTRSLMHGKILARHVAEGGTPYDTFGTYINEMINELNTLSKFIRASDSKSSLSEQAQKLAHEAKTHYHNMRKKAQSMISKKGYHEARDSFDPAAVSESDQAVDSIREMFIEQSVDTRIENALPILAKIKETSMKEINEFESWANQVTEGTWALPDTPEAQEQLKNILANPLPVGPDAINATELLYNILGDDELFDQLSKLAAQDADADARDIIINRLNELGIDVDTTASNDEPSLPTTTQEDLDTDGVMMTRPSNMSSESRTTNLERLRKLALM